MLKPELIKSIGIILQLFFVVVFFQLSFAQGTNTIMVDTLKIGDNKEVGRFIQLRGFKMYYETYGSGEPLLIIHGNGGSINHFIHQIPYFAQKYTVIVADSRDQGKSADAGDSLSYEMMADDLNALQDSLHLDSCYVIGWSDGGINGLLLAIRHPEKVKKLAVTGANLWPDTSAVDPWVYFTVKHFSDSLAHSKTEDALYQYKLFRLLTYEPQISTRDLEKINCPTLVIGGDHDVIHPRHTMLIAQSIPRSYLWILPDSGHSTPVVYKEEFNNVVNRFFTKPYRKIEGIGRFN